MQIKYLLEEYLVFLTIIKRVFLKTDLSKKLSENLKD